MSFYLRLKKHWVNNREAGDLRRHRGHHDVNVMRPNILPRERLCPVCRTWEDEKYLLITCELHQREKTFLDKLRKRHPEFDWTRKSHISNDYSRSNTLSWLGQFFYTAFRIQNKYDYNLPIDISVNGRYKCWMNLLIWLKVLNTKCLYNNPERECWCWFVYDHVSIIYFSDVYCKYIHKTAQHNHKS